MELNVDISGRTKLAGLVGSPVAHSMSPAMHTASFAKLGLNAVYLSFDVQNDKLEDVVKGLVGLGAVGYNVTMPCKTYIGEYLDDLSDEALLMGAVNTVLIRDGRSIGYNTDGAGFTNDMRLRGVEPEGKVATVVGAGGVGSAIFAQLAIEKAAEIRVFNQKDAFWGKAKGRIADIARATDAKISLCDLADRGALRESVAGSDVLVNATRVGMAPDIDGCVIDEDMLHGGLFVADAVYEPRETKLVKMAKAHGLLAASGLGMLLQQAALAEKIWFGIDMPVDYIADRFFS